MTGVQLVYVATNDGDGQVQKRYMNDAPSVYHGSIVEIQPGSTRPRPIASSQRIRYMRLSDGKVFDEPLVYFRTGLRIVDWTTFDMFAQEGSLLLGDPSSHQWVDVEEYFKDFGKFYLDGPPSPTAEPGDASTPASPASLARWTPAPDVVLDYYEGPSDNGEPAFTHLQLHLQNPIAMPASYLCRYLELIELQGNWQRQPNVGKVLWEIDSL